METKTELTKEEKQLAEQLFAERHGFYMARIYGPMTDNEMRDIITDAAIRQRRINVISIVLLITFVAMIISACANQ